MNRRAMAALLLTGAMALGAPACSDGGSDRAAEPAGIEPGRATVVDEAPRLVDAVGAVADLDLEACGVEPGSVQAKGTVANTDEKPSDLVLAVRWVNAKGNRVLDEATVVVRDLGPGKTATWQAEGEVPADHDAVCSTSLERGRIR